MEVRERLQAALEGVTPDTWEFVCPQEPPPEAYIVHNPVLEAPGDFGDNAPQEWMHHVQAHLYTKGGGQGMKGDMKEALQQAGFQISSIEGMRDAGSGYYHTCFSCSIREENEEREGSENGEDRD